MAAAAGVASDALIDVGIDDGCMKKPGATLTPDSTVLFGLVPKATLEKLLAENGLQL